LRRGAIDRRRGRLYTSVVPLISVAVEYVEIHRRDSSDVEIARALRDQGFSDELILEAFKKAGSRPPGSAPERKVSPAKRAIVMALYGACAAALVASAVLFVRNFTRALAASKASAPATR
jgi:hypothetical protein